MRILHTADWHIGQTLAGHGRDAEHVSALASLVAIVAERKPDALLVSGDVFDHQNPSGEALKLYYETLVALKAAHPAMTIVVTAGNHDAAGRLEAPAALLSAMDVHVVGNVRRRDGVIDGSRHLIDLRGADGTLAAEVLAVSYPTASCLPPFASLDIEDGRSPIVAATRSLYAEVYARAGAGQRGVPLIVMGHLHVAGGLESEGAERRILVGGQHAVPPDVFPSDAVYVALGHLHKTQSIGGEHVRYCGSLLPLSASELGYTHGVSLVALRDGAISVEQIAVPRPVPFLRVPASGLLAFDALEAAFAALGLSAAAAIASQPFVQVHLTREGLPPGFRVAVDQLAEAHGVRAVDVRVAAPVAPETAIAVEPGARLAELNPDDLFARAFERKHQRVPEAAHREAFHHALAAAGVED